MQGACIGTGKPMGSVIDVVLGATTSMVAKLAPLLPPAINNLLCITTDPVAADLLAV